ncbi:MAG: stage II sporulation protein P [Clostridia bacterium]|nr:stage II sporulation protein P [Clostridia bacterium]
MKQGIFAIVTAVAISVTAVPKGAAAIPEKGQEYLERLATGTLYVPYPWADKPQFYEEESELFTEDSAENTSASAEESAESFESVESFIPDDAIAVQAVNLSRLEPTETPRLLIANETKYSVDLNTLANTTKSIGAGAVLIIHTHGTEAYLPDGENYYTKDEDFRSTDTEENVVAVGAVFAETLKSRGIQVYHDQSLYDEFSYNNSYTASRAACKEWISRHPDIRYIIDIHRDAITDGDGINQKTLCTVEGQSIAQVMLVIGTDEAGAAHGGWQTNLAVGAKYQQFLNAYPTFARPVYLRRASYNQQLCAGSMLLEVGSAANTLGEAKAAARLAGEVFCTLYDDLRE